MKTLVECLLEALGEIPHTCELCFDWSNGGLCRVFEKGEACFDRGTLSWHWRGYHSPKQPDLDIASGLTLNKGDKAVLKSSNRLFEVIDERNNGGFEELCRFDDDPRHPVWIAHSELSSESRYMTDEEREKWNRRHD